MSKEVGMPSNYNITMLQVVELKDICQLRDTKLLKLVFGNNANQNELSKRGGF